MGWRLTIGLILVAGCSFKGDSRPTDAGVDASPDSSVDAGPPRGNRVSCEPLAPITTADHLVSDIAGLEAAIDVLQPNETIALMPGTYILNERLDIDVDGITLRSTTGVASDVEIQDPGVGSPDLFNMIRVRGGDVTIAGLTVRGGQRNIRIEPEIGAPKSGIRLFDLTVVDFTESGIEVADRTDGTTTDNGLIACSRVSSSRAIACNNFIIALDVRGEMDGWRVTENSIGPVCQNAVSTTHFGIRFYQRPRFSIIDHNRVLGFRAGIVVGADLPPGLQSCNGQDGDGWDTYQSVVCANTVAYNDTGGAASAISGIQFTHSCAAFSAYNTIAFTNGPTFSLRFDGAGSLVDHANNITTGDIGGSQPTPVLNGPDIDGQTAAAFVSFPDDLRPTVERQGAIDLSTNALLEEFCSWDLEGVERDPANPGFGALAPL